MTPSSRKQQLTGAEIASEITRRIYANPDVRANNAQFHVPSATYQPPDEEGCNWTVHLYKATPGYDSVLAQALHDVRSRYMLKH